MNRAPANRSVTLRLLSAIRLRRLTFGAPPGGRVDGRDGGGGRRQAPVDGAMEDLEGLVHDGQLIGVEATEQLPQLALVELAESLEERRRPRVSR